MRPLEPSDVVDLACYAPLRDAYRRAVIAHKKARRVAIGEKVTLLFEDRETLRFQVQEMLWVERIGDPAQVQQELDVYNELMPGAHELSATLFVEITEAQAIRPELDRLIGIDEHVALVLGDDGAEHHVRARFDPKQLDEERIAAVQYVRFALPQRSVQALSDPRVPARLRIDHPNYCRECEIPPSVRHSLVAGLTAEPEPLLRPPSDGGGREAPLRQAGRVRVVRPARAAAPGHVVVETEPPVALADADAALLAQVMEQVRELAADVAREHGSCVVLTDAGPRAGPMRWHVHARPR